MPSVGMTVMRSRGETAREPRWLVQAVLVVKANGC